MSKKLIIIILLILLLISLLASSKIQKFTGKASSKLANIIIDTNNSLGPLNNNWSNFAQGGEELPPMLTATIPNMKPLNPKFIRLDHIYDYYNIVKKQGDTYLYDFTSLDKTVYDIIAIGGNPFFSLSYMPSSFTQTGSIIDTPVNWSDWEDIVKSTIEHYSGKNNLNLSDVYYEVWNEPELPQFGSWTLTPNKDYRLLYFYSSNGAQKAQNVNRFYLGGPAVGSFYNIWVKDFIDYISQNQLRFDFYSWHRYHKDPNKFITDANSIRNLLSSYSNYANIPLILSEWNIESENTQINNSNIAAAFTLSTIISLQDKIHSSFAFEIKDGPSPWGGKWGLLTHESSPNPLSPKPRYKVFEYLEKLGDSMINLSGVNTYIRGIAAKSSQKITVLITNYDISNNNLENVPITFTGLEPFSYNLHYIYPLDGNSGNYELISTDGKLNKSFLMLPNTILFLELSKNAPLALFIPGVSGESADKALVLSSDVHLNFNAPQFHLTPKGEISFDIKPFWNATDNRSFIIFEAPFLIDKNNINKLSLSKQSTLEGNILQFGITGMEHEIFTSIPIKDWEKDKWHHIDLSWDYIGLSISIDNNIIKTIEIPLDIRNGEALNFYPIDAAIDNLKIVLGGKQLISRFFNGSLEK